MFTAMGKGFPIRNCSSLHGGVCGMRSRSSPREKEQGLADGCPIGKGNEEHHQIGGKGHPQTEAKDFRR